MVIGIDARAAAEERGGRGRYVRELLAHLARLPGDHEYVLYARERWDGAQLDERFTWSLTRRPDVVWHLGVALRASARCDVFFSTNSYLTAWFTRVPTVLAVYDMVAWLDGASAQRRAAVIERLTLRPAVDRAAAVMAISEATRSDLVARYPSAAGKTTVVPLAADERFRPGEGDGASDPFVLVVGTLEPRKNLPRLIQAFAGLDPRLRERYRLVLAGAKGWQTDETFASIKEHADAVTTLGYVSDEELAALYRSAEVVCYPSLYEGFGLPVLEAMQSGTAVLTSNTSSMPEVGGDAARYVDPLDVDDIRAVLQELLADPEQRERLAQRGRERSRQFSWERTARETLALLEAQR
jgi:glycosyltransferase involved in cell wall biosynthesis